jgi:hypothetical protein
MLSRNHILNFAFWPFFRVAVCNLILFLDTAHLKWSQGPQEAMWPYGEARTLLCTVAMLGCLVD